MAIGPALRALYSFLKEKDKAQQWGGLQKVVTPDGNILWLCEIFAFANHQYHNLIGKGELYFFIIHWHMNIDISQGKRDR